MKRGDGARGYAIDQSESGSKMNPRRRDSSAPKPVGSRAGRAPVAATRKARSSAPSKALPNAPEHVETRQQTEISDPEQAYRERLHSLTSEREQVRTQGD